jgi:DNA-binding response OmpR family regulator
VVYKCFADPVIDTFDGAKPRFLNRGKKRRSVSTLSIPRASDRGVEWVDLNLRGDLLKYPSMKILLVEDDKAIVRFVKKGLVENSFSVDVAFDGEEGLFLGIHRKYDLVILDIMLPEIDGIELLKRMRGTGVHVPVIFLTARDREKDIVHGLNLGADDYMTKPFSFNELLARIRAISRRGKMVTVSSSLQVANLILEFDGHRVFRGQTKIDLTPKEYALLEFFMRHPGQIVTRTMISEKIWDYHFDSGTNIIDVHVSHLRNKIDKDFEPKLLHTIKGVGYVLEKRD